MSALQHARRLALHTLQQLQTYYYVQGSRKPLIMDTCSVRTSIRVILIRNMFALCVIYLANQFPLGLVVFGFKCHDRIFTKQSPYTVTKYIHNCTHA